MSSASHAGERDAAGRDATGRPAEEPGVAARPCPDRTRAVELTVADELAHPPGDERLWGESWYFDFTNREGTLGGYVRLGLYPNLGVAWYWACLVGEGRPLVTVIDHEVALPKAPSLEIRADGLWADHVVETPFDHMTLGCEAFAVARRRPGRGLRRPPRRSGAVRLRPRVGDRPGGLYPWIGTTRYEVSCNVHGEILVGDETIDFDGIGQRDHSWGVRDWWSLGWVWTAGRPRRRHPLPHRTDPCSRHGRVRARLRAAARRRRAADRRVPRRARTLGEHGFPTSGEITCGPLELAVEPRYFSPVHLVDEGPDGTRHARFPRALCRFETADGRSGVGWTEWNQPVDRDLTGVGGVSTLDGCSPCFPTSSTPNTSSTTFGLLGIWAIVFAESGLLFGFFLPGDALLFTAGFLASGPSASRDLHLPLLPLVIGIWIAAIVGDQVGYVFGQRVGPALFKRPDSRFFKQENVDKAHEFFDKHGPRAIVLARFVPIVRTFTPIIAGVSGMEYRTFVRWNVIGGTIWACGVTFLGYFLGQVDVIEQNLELASSRSWPSPAADRLRAPQGAPGEAAHVVATSPTTSSTRPGRHGRRGPPPRRPALRRRPARLGGAPEAVATSAHSRR